MDSQVMEHQVSEAVESTVDAQKRHKPDRKADPAGEAGWYLTQERLRRGIGLEAAGEATGIHPYHIFAIEHGDMTHMPPRLEALEMIAAYANYLGFDPEPLLQHYLTFLPPPQLAPKRHPADPAPLSSAKIVKFGRFVPKIPTIDLKNFKLPSVASYPGGQNGIVASVAAAFILFSSAVWLASSPDAPAPPEQIAVVEDGPALGDPMPTATTGSNAAEVTVTEKPLASENLAKVDTGQGTAPAVQNPDDLGAFIQQTLTETDGVVAPAIDAPIVEASVPAANAKPLLIDGQAYGSEDPAARLVIKATADVWVRIESATGQVLMTQGLKKGDVYRVPNEKGLTIIAKDGGLLTYFIDGESKGLLGRPGEILANETLDIATLSKRG